MGNSFTHVNMAIIAKWRPDLLKNYIIKVKSQHRVSAHRMETDTDKIVRKVLKIL